MPSRTRKVKTAGLDRQGLTKVSCECYQLVRTRVTFVCFDQIGNVHYRQHTPTGSQLELTGILVETIREGLLVLDADLTVPFANRSFCDTFAVTPEDTYSRP